MFRPNGEPVLYHIDCDGSERQIETYEAVGSGKPYVNLFFERLWDVGKSTSESVFLACLVIKFVEKMNLDNFVGCGDNEVPQVVLIMKDGRMGSLEVDKKSFLKNMNPLIEQIDSSIRRIKSITSIDF